MGTATIYDCDLSGVGCNSTNMVCVVLAMPGCDPFLTGFLRVF